MCEPEGLPGSIKLEVRRDRLDNPDNPIKNFKIKIGIERKDNEEKEHIEDLLYINIDDYYNETEYWISLDKLVEKGIAEKNVRNH